jgi:ketosteroid isomerase-like protein
VVCRSSATVSCFGVSAEPDVIAQAVATYLAAEKAKDPNMLTLCFAHDALVHDEGRNYRGLDAIRSWKREAEAKYRYIME